MNGRLLILLKIALTLLLVACVVLSISNGSGSGVLREVEQLGVVGSFIVLIIFFILVAFYCRDLQSILQLIEPHNRAASPKSVWLMFLIPYNFIEDFFIVANVSKSIKRQSKTTLELQHIPTYGIFSGLGWCVAQIVSFAPDTLGQVASLIAIALWVIHWRLMFKIKAVLKRNQSYDAA